MSKSRMSEQALSVLIKNRSQFLNFIKKRVSSLEVAEDLLQAALTKGIEKGGLLQDDDRVVAWFYRILRNALVDHYRQNGRSLELNGLLVDLDAYGKTTPEAARDVCQCMNPILEDLKPEYREALTTIDLGDGSLADLATRAGITEQNAAVRVHRARKAMRAQVEVTCGSCAEGHCMNCDCR